jgi:hypothetical protein
MNQLRDEEAAGSAPPPHELEPELEDSAYRRDRLLASLALMFGAGLALALPFALRAGAEFFLPVTAALVIAIALRLPSAHPLAGRAG